MKIPKYALWPWLCLVLLVLSVGCKQAQPGKQDAAGEIGMNEGVQVDTITDYLAAGQELAAATQAVLGKNLIEAINRDGAAQALSFCNIRAHPLTDSLARSHRAGIRRVTDKPRNPANAANADELDYITRLKAGMASGQAPAGAVVEQGGKMVAYYPILTNALCLQCHGSTANEIQPMTMALIHALYPEDKAIGYGVNEVRGLWVVEMDKR